MPFPAAQVPISDPDSGLINAVWYLFFSGLPSAPVAPTSITAATFVVGGQSSLIADFVSTVTLTLPAAGQFPGRLLNIKTLQADVISDDSNVVPLAGGAAGTSILSATPGKWATLQSNGVDWEIMAAN